MNDLTKAAAPSGSTAHTGTAPTVAALSPTEITEGAVPDAVAKWADADLRQVLVVRHDLNMRRGKLVAQTGHAPVMLMQNTPGAGFRTNAAGKREFVVPDEDGSLEAWMTGGQKKVCVSVKTDAELLDLFERATAAGLRCTMVTDAGHTEYHGVATRTVMSIGPHPRTLLDPFTGPDKLPLY